MEGTFALFDWKRSLIDPSIYTMNDSTTNVRNLSPAELKRIQSAYDTVPSVSVGVRSAIYDLGFDTIENRYKDKPTVVRYSTGVSIVGDIKHSITVADLGLDPDVYEMNVVWVRILEKTEFTDVYEEYYTITTSSILSSVGGLVAIGS